MYAKLDKLREDLKKAVAKRDAAEAKVKRLEEKLREEENQQIVSDVCLLQFNTGTAGTVLTAG